MISPRLRLALALLTSLVLIVSTADAGVSGQPDGSVLLTTPALNVWLDPAGDVSGTPGSILDGWVEDDRGMALISSASLAWPQAMVGDTPAALMIEDVEIQGGANRLIVHGTITAGPDGQTLQLTQRWQPQGQSLLVRTVWTASDTTVVAYPQRLRFEDTVGDTARFLNAAGEVHVGANRHQTWCTQNGFLADAGEAAMAVLINSPFLGDFSAGDGDITLTALRVWDDRGMDETRPVTSILAAGDSLALDLQLHFEPASNGILADEGVLAGFSAHRGDASGTIHFATDAVPYRSAWEVFDGLNDLDTPVYSTFNQLLVLYPEMRYNALAIFDNSLDIHNGVYAPDSTGGWAMNDGNISFVTHHATRGQRSCRMEIYADASCWIRQQVWLEQDDEVQLLVDAFTEDDLTEPLPVRLRLKKASGGYDHEQAYALSPDEWTTLTLPVDESVPLNGFYEVWIYGDRLGGAVYLDNVRLDVTRPGEPEVDVPLSNASFETGRTWLIYDDDGDTWWDAHCHRCTVHSATERFKDLLRKWDGADGSPAWEDRIKLALHGCHHNWRSDSTDYNGRAEMTGSAAEQRLAFEAMDWHRQQIGLSEDMMRFWRAPGIRYTTDTPHLAMEYGVEMMDYRYAWEENYWYQQVGVHGRIWWNNSCWWGDGGWGISLTAMNNALNAGQIALLGTHPAETYYQYGEAWIYDIFGQMIDNNPHAAWEFSQDIIDRANTVTALDAPRSEYNRLTRTLSYTFHGESAIPLSVVCFHNDSLAASDLAVLDGTVLCETTTRDGRTYIELPPMDDGFHLVEVPFGGMVATVEDASPPSVASYRLLPWPNPTNGELRVRWDSDLRGPAQLRLYDILGRSVLDQTLTLDGNPLDRTISLSGQPSGTYLVQVHHPASGIGRTQRITLVK